MELANFSELLEDVEVIFGKLKEVEDPSITLRSAIVEGKKFLTSLQTLDKSKEIKEPKEEVQVPKR